MFPQQKHSQFGAYCLYLRLQYFRRMRYQTNAMAVPQLPLPRRAAHPGGVCLHLESDALPAPALVSVIGGLATERL